MSIPYKSDNEYKHKKTDSLYAHYSGVDEYDVDKFPKLQFAHPFTVTLREGESLYIPKKWWHWVKTTQKTFAINYWFINAYKENQAPFVFQHTIEYDTKKLSAEEVCVWNSTKHHLGDRKCIQTFEEFYNSGQDDVCVITLNNFELGASNVNIKNKLSNYIKFPINNKISTIYSYEYNLWFCSNKHDTGLHYDDEDGILSVIEGEKSIILFPPSDTQYLYPYDMSIEWTQAAATKFHYNAFRNYEGKVRGICSGNLLHQTCNGDARVLSNISKLYYQYPNVNLIWGFKKDKDQYRWEIYYYTLHDNIKIRSWDINQNEHNIPNIEHYYYKMDDKPAKLPFWGHGKYKKDDVLYDECKIFVIDTYQSFRINFDSYMKKLGYNSISLKFKKIILDTYDCYEICIHNKRPDHIFVQYLGISNVDFLFFLKEQSYPLHIIEYVQAQMVNDNYHINNEITIVYDIETQNIVRSGFYGNL